MIDTLAFHSYYDAAVRPYQAYKSGEGWTATTAQKEITIQDRKLSYRFYPHYHPYVAELVRRLIEGSVPGLQAADTEYVENADGTLKTLPGSMRAALSGSTTAKLRDGTEIKLASGAMLMLPDDVQVTLEDGTQVTLPGDILVTSPGGMRVTPSSGTSVTIRDRAKVTLSSDTEVKLSDGTPVALPGGTQVVFFGGRPRPELYEEIFSEAAYKPTELVQQPYPVKDLDFTSGSAYGVYNWELFYHAPLTIAIHLSKNQRFEEAQRWFHHIFDPTDDSDGPTPERFWRVKPFQYTDVRKIEEILVNLSTNADPALRQETINSIGAWRDAPFRPHVVARYRQSAYMLKTVMAYLDNLVAWGDSMFRQDTGESINEATQLYVLAANILGPRPQTAPKKGSVRPQTYANLKKDLDEFGDALVELEPDLALDLAPHPNGAADVDRFGTLRSLGKALYFCMPRNDRLLSYWDTVADRLFKIRNSLNIQGIFRQLPLFEPPIDPALLAKAAAAGLDVGAIVSGANQPLPLVRFQFLLQKAAEICQEVKALGNNLLLAIEKEDNEALAALRAKHERVVLGLAETVRYAQWQEAIKAREGLEKSLANAIQRYTYYERLLGKQQSEITVPELDALDSAGLEKMMFQTSEPDMGLRVIDLELTQDNEEVGGKKLNVHELEEMGKLKAARDLQDKAASNEDIAGDLGLSVDYSVNLSPFGVGLGFSMGGTRNARFPANEARKYRADADRRSYEATKSGKVGSYARREQEWAFQGNLAAGEITQTFKQLRAAQIREHIAKREWENHKQQIRHAEEIEYFLTGEATDAKPGPTWRKKQTNEAFYAWMKREVKGLYGQCFQFAFDVARKAERALQHELGDPGLSFLQFGYLAGKEGLLAGEKLYLDIKRMEMAYHDLNQREYELIKHVSLLQVNPLALLELRATGKCTVFLPEELFDMDCPGHYFRRIKSVAVSIPAVAGPYTSVNCKLTLQKSRIRKSPEPGADGYAYAGGEDSRFSEHFGSLQGIVTSTGQSDSGMFETNLRDERYLPFEGSGVVSEWQLELPKDFRQFDYDTISDVILHLRYTAREGGGSLRTEAVKNLSNRVEEAQAAGSVRLFSVRREFPTEWAKFKSVKIAGPATAAELSLNVREEHFPYWSKGRLEAIKRVDLFAKKADGTGIETRKPSGSVEITTRKSNGTESKATLTNLTDIALPKAPDKLVTLKFALSFADNSMEDLWLAVTWGGGD